MSPAEGPKQWTQEELETLHEMVVEYGHARWLRKQAKFWLWWILGIPTVILSTWEPIAKLIGMIKGLGR